jgi:hypothetical protein
MHRPCAIASPTNAGLRHSPPQPAALTRQQAAPTEQQRPARISLARWTLKRLTATPGRLMLLVWGLFAGFHALRPIEFSTPATAQTWQFVAASIGLFLLGSAAGGQSWRRAVPAPRWNWPRPYLRRLRRIAIACVLLGVLGGAAIYIDKMFLSGLDYSEGATAVRLARTAEASAGIERHQSSYFLHFGLLTSHFSLAGLLLYLLAAESLPRRYIWLVPISLVSPALFAYSYGGRSPVIAALLLCAAAFLVRAMMGRPAIPRAKAVSAILAAAVLAAALYNSFIFGERREFRNLDHYSAALRSFERAGLFRVRPWVDEWTGHGTVAPGIALDAISSYFYLTVGITGLERVLNFSDRLGPYAGQYQIQVLPIALDRVWPEMSLLREMRHELLVAGAAGVFTTAFGSLLLDFGWAGLAIAVFLWGWLSGRYYRRSLRARDPSAPLMLCFFVWAVLLSPIHSAVGISNAVMIPCICLLVARLVKRRAPRRGLAARRTPWPVGFPSRAVTADEWDPPAASILK